MCGICGAIAFAAYGPRHDLEARVRGMLAAMEHRGPDGAVVVARTGLVMGVNRLAIRKGTAGRPPLVAGEGGVLVACNGEIDNHRELGRALADKGYSIPLGTDVSILAPLYARHGLGFARAVHGVFAVAVWDPLLRRLVLARDRAGERHLHYLVADGIAYFASELAALLTLPEARRAVDGAAVRSYLARGYCLGPNDPVTDCRKVRPGEEVIIDAAGVRVRQFWEPPLGRVPKVAPSCQAFDGIFREAVRRQTDVDVDYGVLLSGGVDSALITAVARSVRPARKLTAYCARFSEASFDEGDCAARVAHSLGCTFVPVLVAPAAVPGALRHLIATTGELLADPAWIPHAMVARRASLDVPMLLGGEGADELFGGYPTYLGASLATRYARLPQIVRNGVRRWATRRPAGDKNMTLRFLLQRFVQGQQLDGVARHRLWTASVPPELVTALAGGAPVPAVSRMPDLQVMDAIQRSDFTESLAEALLAKADRGGMSYGVEVRAPFLDAAVIEFSAHLPVAARVRGITTKVFLKHYAARYLPGAVVNRRKRGLSVPLGAWLRGPLHTWARACLAHAVLQDAGIDNLAALRLLAAHRAREHDHARAIWTLIVLSEWLQWKAGLHTVARARVSDALLQLRA